MTSPPVDLKFQPSIPVENTPGGDVALACAGIAFAGFGIWLAVRVINRKEKWAIRVSKALLLLVVYLASFGPACWLTSRLNLGASAIPVVYRPIWWAMRLSPRLGDAFTTYAKFAAPESWFLLTWSGMEWADRAGEAPP
jgi:hypothetical protein